MNKEYLKYPVLILCFLLMPSPGMSSDKAGEVRALSGKATIYRSGKSIGVSAKDVIFLMDTIETEKASKAKILFVDDSLLTLAENSRLLVKEYLTGDDKKRGQSIFTLIDGKVRAVVGRNALEIHTPTAVAAARGTVLVPWVKPGSSCIAVIKGVVETSNINTAIKGTEAVSGGYMNCVDAGQPPSTPVLIPPDLLKQLMVETMVSESPQVSIPQHERRHGKPEGDLNIAPVDGGMSIPPIEREPLVPQPKPPRPPGL